MNAIVVHCSNNFTLTAQGSALVVTNKRTEESYPITQIQSFKLKEPKGLSLGTLTFCTAQAASSGVNLGFGLSAAIGAENNFFFSKAELEAAKALRDYVIHYGEAKTEGTVVSVVEEIRGLKGLLDEGILTQEEFDAKKKQLLGI